MQLIGRIFYGISFLIITSLSTLIVGSIPPLSSNAQNDSKPLPGDSLSKRMENIIGRFETVQEKLDNNNDKAKQIINILDKLDKPKSSIESKKDKSSVRIVYSKPKIIKVPTYKDTTLYYIRGKYTSLPVIVQPACITYGGDTFKTKQTTYQGPLAGLIPDKPLKDLFKKRRHENKLEQD